MFINLIIDQLLPLKPRLATLVPRASWSITSSSTSTSNPGARSYSNNLTQDSLRRKSDSISQGHVTSPYNKNQQDIQSAYVRDAKAARENMDNFSIDAASQNTKPDPSDRTQGNPEGMGMLDQVGSATGTAKFFEGGGKQGVTKN
ncbi:hypothetical protein BDN70DRAFT_57966 [Pholiota conissans]|uniref:Uncharacterized protein n=1 Tax=Pholiota conissans TaxID=109636 RepID=A0A9P5ZFA9_9AGAR|nr:hypothetical protein BDN70DRAFT_57966 [Pholiota conissans]